MAVAIDERASRVLSYWFGEGFSESEPAYFPGQQVKLWFGGGPDIDKHITESFLADWQAVVDGQCDAWRAPDSNPLNAMASVILLDQFSRNMFRGTPKAFASDAAAMSWTRHLVESGKASQLPLIMRAFLTLPFQHMEDLAAQEEGVALTESYAEQAAATPDAQAVAGFLSNFVTYAKKHRDVVAQWGRFPHRNAIVGRPSTEAEEKGLADGSIAKF